MNKINDNIVNQFKNINQIDFGALYKAHIQSSERKPKTAQDWDNKSDRMALHLGEATDPYVKAFIEKMSFSDAESLLDVGCGPGTICLPIAQHFKKVFALDFSKGMLERLMQVATTKNISNIQPLLKSWDDDWFNVPECDIIVASRASIVQDMEKAINKLNSKAKKRVYTTHGVDKHFMSEKILNAIDRHNKGLPNYIYPVNILQQMGYLPHVDYIDTPLNKPQPSSFEELKNSVEWSLGTLTSSEEDKLHQYYITQTQNGLPTMKTSRTWALVWWDVRI